MNNKKKNIEKEDKYKLVSINDLFIIVAVVLVVYLLSFFLVKFLLPIVFNMDKFDDITAVFLIIVPFFLTVLSGIMCAITGMFSERLNNLFLITLNVSFFIYFIDFAIILITRANNNIFAIIIYSIVLLCALFSLYKYIKNLFKK